MKPPSDNTALPLQISYWRPHKTFLLWRLQEYSRCHGIVFTDGRLHIKHLKCHHIFRLSTHLSIYYTDLWLLQTYDFNKSEPFRCLTAVKTPNVILLMDFPKIHQQLFILPKTICSSKFGVDAHYEDILDQTRLGMKI